MTPDSNYQNFLLELKNRIRAAQYAALKAVNQESLALYWHIGQQIVQKQALFGWGKSIVEQLAKDIQTEFVGVTGFSARNLWLMKQFYETYSKSSILQPLVAEIGWAHHLQIMSKCKSDLEKEFYILMTKKFGWTKNVLIHQIENKTYEQYLLNQTNFDKTVPEKYQNQAISEHFKKNNAPCQKDSFPHHECPTQTRDIAHLQYYLCRFVISNLSLFHNSLVHASSTK
jgi:predicted nuclease of restriction endonuclease-like (RecB) superfamily